MKKFLKAMFGVGEKRPSVGDTRITYWEEPSTQLWNWHCQDGNNQVVCSSNQGYLSKGACIAGIENAADAMGWALENNNLVKRTVAE